MKKFLTAMLFLLAVGSLFAATVTRTVKVSEPYSVISAATGLDVEYVAAKSATTVTLTGPSEYLDEISVAVSKSKLVIKSKRKSINGNRYKDVTIRVTAPVPDAFEVSSSAEIKALGAVEALDKTLGLAASSSGELKFSYISCASANFALSSSGEVEVGVLNAASDVNIASSSSADLEIDKLIAATVSVSASSSCDVEMKTVKVNSLNIVASSSADVEISGIAAQNVNATASSSADVKLAGSAGSMIATATSSADIDAGQLNAGSRSVTANSGGSIN